MDNKYSFSKEHTAIAKGVAMVLMLFDHLFWTGYGESYDAIIKLPNGHDIPWLIGSVGNICVAMFLFLSGYGMFYTQSKKENYSFKDSLQRIKKLWLQYAFITVIIIGLDLAFEKIKFNLKTILLNLFALDYEYNAFAWFMITYIVILILFPLLNAIFKRLSWYFELLAIVVIKGGITVFYSFVSKTISVPQIAYKVCIEPLMFLPVFLLGYVCAKYHLMEKITEKLKSELLIRSIAFIVFIGTFIFMIFVPNTVFDNITAPILVVAVAYLMHRTLLGKAFQFIGNHSTNMWLIHFPLITTLIPEVIYAPKYWLLILLWIILLMTPICYGIDFILNLRRGNR